MSASSFSEEAPRAPSSPAIAFLQASRRSFTMSDSSASGDFTSRPSVGNGMGKHSRARSQPRARQRRSSRIAAAVDEKLSE